MTIIRFPGRGPCVIAQSNPCPTCIPHQTGDPTLQATDRSLQLAIAREREAVRHFALTMAEKILTDSELNHTAPLLVDKIVRMLVNESRYIQGEENRD